MFLCRRPFCSTKDRSRNPGFQRECLHSAHDDLSLFVLCFSLFYKRFAHLFQHSLSFHLILYQIRTLTNERAHTTDLALNCGGCSPLPTDTLRPCSTPDIQPQSMGFFNSTPLQYYPPLSFLFCLQLIKAPTTISLPPT